MGTNSKRLSKNIVMLTLMNLAKYILPFLATPYLARVLEPETYGVVTYLTSVMTYFQMLVDFGFQFSATRKASLSRDDVDALGALYANTVCARGFLAVLGGVLLLCILPFIALLRENAGVTVLYYLSVVATIFLPDFIFRGLERMEIVSLRFIIAKMISTGLTFVFIRSKDDLLWLPVLSIAGTLAATAFSLRTMLRKYGIRVKAPSLRKALSETKESGPFFIATFATTAFGALNTLSMGFVQLSAQLIAYWGIAYQVISAIQTLYDPITSSIYPHMVKERDYRLIKRILLIFMPLVVVGTLLCYVLSDWIILVIGGAQYAEAAPVFVALLPILLFSFPSQVLGFPVLAPIGKEKWVTFSTIIAAVTQVSGLLALAFTGHFTILNVATLRSITDFVLLLARGSVFLRFLRMGCFSRPAPEKPEMEAPV